MPTSQKDQEVNPPEDQLTDPVDQPTGPESEAVDAPEQPVYTGPTAQPVRYTVFVRHGKNWTVYENCVLPYNNRGVIHITVSESEFHWHSGRDITLYMFEKDEKNLAAILDILRLRDPNTPGIQGMLYIKCED